MRRIHKGSEPRSLAVHRRNGGNYETYKERDDVRAALIKEQGAICCYCMQRISLRNMRIEHWDSQTGHPARTVDYDNLLGACTGGENTLPQAQQHCDTARGDREIHIHPSRYPPSCEQFIRYLPDGRVESKDKIINDDLVVVLKLNTEPLQRGRKRTLDVMMSELLREKKADFWPPGFLEKFLERWQSRDKAGEYREYCQVVIYYLEKKLKKKI